MNRRDFVRVFGLASALFVSGAVLAKEGKKDLWIITFRKKGKKEELTEEILAKNLEHARETFRKKHPDATILGVERKP